MELQRQFPVGLLDVLDGGAAGHPQDLVEVPPAMKEWKRERGNPVSAEPGEGGGGVGPALRRRGGEAGPAAHSPGGGLPAEAKQQEAEAAKPARGHSAAAGPARDGGDGQRELRSPDGSAAARPGPGTIRREAERGDGGRRPIGARRSPARGAPPAYRRRTLHHRLDAAGQSPGKGVGSQLAGPMEAQGVMPLPALSPRFCEFEDEFARRQPIRRCVVYSRLRAGSNSQSKSAPRGRGRPVWSPPRCEGRGVSLLCVAAALRGSSAGTGSGWQ